MTSMLPTEQSRQPVAIAKCDGTTLGEDAGNPVFVSGVISSSTFSNVSAGAALASGTAFSQSLSAAGDYTNESITFRGSLLTPGASVTLTLSYVYAALGATYTTAIRTVTGTADASGDFSFYECLCGQGRNGADSLLVGVTTTSVAVAGIGRAVLVIGQ